MRIVVDDRERRSGIIEILKKIGADVTIKRLLCGDYLIDGQLVVERKSAHDFIESIKNGRLFSQVREMKKLQMRTVLLIDGDPYRTAGIIKPNAVRGCILSICAVWQLPVLFTSSVQDTADIFQTLSKHLEFNNNPIFQRCYFRPKRIINRQLYIIQGLPGVGSRLAWRLLSHFKSVSGVFAAEAKELVKVDGIGAEKARQIRAVLDAVCKD